MKNKLTLLNICLLIASVYLGLLIFKPNIKSLFNKPVCDHCNVILISLDTLGANHLPCYGYERNTSPNLCKFAKNNVIFTNMFSNASWTLPSHFSIFTSLYPNHHKMINYGINKLDPKTNTMAELFKKNNYKTIYVGPLNNLPLPLDRGLGKGFDTMISSLDKYSNFKAWDKGITQLIENNKKKESTLLFLHTYWVHSSYLVNEASGENSKRIFTKDFYGDVPLNYKDNENFSKDFLDFIINKYENKIENDNPIDKKNDQYFINSLKKTKNIADAEKIYNNLIPLTYVKDGFISDFYLNKIVESNDKVSYAESLYDEMIFYLDKKMSMIFDLVKNPELANNTIIIITSDHGEEFMEHGSVSHPADHLYNTTTAVPLIIYIPGIKQKRIDNLVQSIDILPTILNLTGQKNLKNNFDGIDLSSSIISHRQTKLNDYLISEGPGVDSIRNNRWKLYVSNSQDGISTQELYDLLKDPQEKNNMAKNEPKVVKDLSDNLNRIIYRK